MTEGLHIPVIPLGEVVFNAGAVSPLHKVNVVMKSGTTFAEIVRIIVSEISRPQLFTAVRVKVIVPVALVGMV